MRHPKTSPEANGVRVLPQIEPGWVLVLVGFAVVALACGGVVL